MKSLKVITSMWTGTTHYDCQQEKMLMQTLSIALARETQGNLHLVTDSFGREIAEELGWEFSSVSAALDKMPSRMGHIWAAGKLYAALMQKERHMQIDGDVLLFKHLEPKGELFTQSVDDPGNYRNLLIRALIESAGLEPESDAYNCGVLGGDPQAIQAFATDALDLCARKLLPFKRLGTICSMVAEQYFLGIHARRQGKVVHTLFKELPTDQEARTLGYCHMQGSSKSMPKWSEKARKRMQTHFPEKLAKFDDRIGNVTLAAGLRP